VSPEAVAEAPNASTEEVKAAEVEEKGVSAPSIEEANPEVKEYELLIVVDTGFVVPEVLK
jgi:hypothetical protein